MGIKPFNRFRLPVTPAAMSMAETSASEGVTQMDGTEGQSGRSPVAPAADRPQIDDNRHDTPPVDQEVGRPSLPMTELPPLVDEPLPRQRYQSVPRRLARRMVRGSRSLVTPAIWLGLAVLSAGAVVTAFVWLARIPPAPDCKNLPKLAADIDRLYCAEQAARSGQEKAILAGFNLVKDWSGNHPLHNRANRSRREWSKALLSIAQKKADQGNLLGAIALVQKIPANGPLHKEVQATIAGWQKHRNLGKQLENAFLISLKQQDWLTAEERILALARLNSDADWRSRVGGWRRRLKLEQDARDQLAQVRWMVDQAPDQVDTLTLAIAQTRKVIPGTYAQIDARVDSDRWSQTLLTIAAERLSQGDVNGAIESAQAVPFHVIPSGATSDLVWFSRARQLTTQKVPDVPLPEYLWQFWSTLSQLQQFKPNSPFYQQGRALIPQLEQHIQDLNHLQAATVSADLGQIPALQVAVQMAQMVKPDRPQRIYAQTLIAAWQTQMEQLVDRPNLAKAQALAKGGTLPKLKAAIAQAQLISPKRALRAEAQAAIAQWNRQVQTLEDRPILERANTLARQKKLKQAIQTARKIRPGRALYASAQTAIKGWTDQIQIAEDRPTLEKANALASQGDLGAAIGVAAQIGSDRALYNEAQALIGGWVAQQEEISRPSRRDAGESDTADDTSGRYGSRRSYRSRSFR